MSGRELREGHREGRRVLLAAEGLLERLVAAVDPDIVAAHVRRAEEGKSP